VGDACLLASSLPKSRGCSKGAVRDFAKKEFTPKRSREYFRKEYFPWDLYRKMC
jgi:hypothetical protein